MDEVSGDIGPVYLAKVYNQPLYFLSTTKYSFKLPQKKIIQLLQEKDLLLAQFPWFPNAATQIQFSIAIYCIVYISIHSEMFFKS